MPHSGGLKRGAGLPVEKGYEMQVVDIHLAEIVLTVEFTHLRKNRDRADHMLGLLKKHGEKDPERVLSGWVTRGTYRF